MKNLYTQSAFDSSERFVWQEQPKNESEQVLPSTETGEEMSKEEGVQQIKQLAETDIGRQVIKKHITHKNKEDIFGKESDAITKFRDETKRINAKRALAAKVGGKEDDLQKEVEALTEYDKGHIDDATKEIGKIIENYIKTDGNSFSMAHGELENYLKSPETQIDIKKNLLDGQKGREAFYAIASRIIEKSVNSNSYNRMEKKQKDEKIIPVDVTAGLMKADFRNVDNLTAAFYPEYAEHKKEELLAQTKKEGSRDIAEAHISTPDNRN